MISPQVGNTTYGQAWYCGSAEQEARSLLPLLRTAGQTVADVLDLIRVAPEEERLLRAFAEKFPDLKSKIECSLDYRLRVEREFCRLAGDVGAPHAEILTPAAPVTDQTLQWSFPR